MTRVLATTVLLTALGFGQTVRIRAAAPQELVGMVDSNSPAYWDGGTRYVYNSFQLPVRSEGGGLTASPRARAVRVNGTADQFRWIESVYAYEGYVFAWYHAERADVCPGKALAVPYIGAMVSEDGIHFDDLGTVLQAPGAPDCEARNNYFAGGNGDFTVIADRNREYLYFIYTNYGGPVQQQGVAVARMGFEDRWAPAGRVWKFHDGGWNEPGIGGIEDPIFPAERSWTGDRPLSYWGPSVHWNTVLERYVVIMNQAYDRIWNQSGLYISFSQDLANPESWSPPVQLIYVDGWYPQVMGSGAGETDSLAGANARLFVMGQSEWELTFEPGPARIVHEPAAALAGRAPHSTTLRRVTAGSPSKPSSATGSTSASPRRIRRPE